MHKGTLKAGMMVRTILNCERGNAGTAALTHMFISDSDGAMPPPRLDFVVPGNSLMREDEVPLNAASCRVSVELPPSGKGTLTVMQGSSQWTGTLAGGESWLFDVSP